jgi:hypothetical protein
MAQGEANSFDHRHVAFDQLLKAHVVLSDGGRVSRVRYADFARDRSRLRVYLEELSRVPEGSFQRWRREERMAFLLNAYNAAMIEKVLTRHPDIASVWDFGRVIGNPFKDRFIRLFGRTVSLDDIEHDTLRKPGAYDEPRIHFAVNCASRGCPMLREEAYVAERLERQLEEQTERFLSDRSRNRASADGRLEVSMIFRWYGDDFARGRAEGLAGFLARYAPLLAEAGPARERILSAKAPLTYLEYDWSLNDQGEKRP